MERNYKYLESTMLLMHTCLYLYAEFISKNQICGMAAAFQCFSLWNRLYGINKAITHRGPQNFFERRTLRPWKFAKWQKNAGQQFCWRQWERGCSVKGGRGGGRRKIFTRALFRLIGLEPKLDELRFRLGKRCGKYNIQSSSCISALASSCTHTHLVFQKLYRQTKTWLAQFVSHCLLGNGVSKLELLSMRTS